MCEQLVYQNKIEHYSCTKGGIQVRTCPVVPLLYQQREHCDHLEATEKRNQAINEKLLINLTVVLCRRRKAGAAVRPVLDSSALSSDDDDDSLYDPSTITSILTESNLQTSSC